MKLPIYQRRACLLRQKGRPYTCRGLWPHYVSAWCVRCRRFAKLKKARTLASSALLALTLAAAVIRPNYEVPTYPDKGPEYDLRLPPLCTMPGSGLCIISPLRDPQGQENFVDREKRLFQERRQKGNK